jgi:putative SOS response-associated peptidase YedK
VPYFTKNLKKARKPINARPESIAGSGMFKEAFARRRCLVPAPVYYEWRDDPKGKTPFAVARVDGAPVAFGGIWEEWRFPEGEGLQTFAPSRSTPICLASRALTWRLTERLNS